MSPRFYTVTREWPGETVFIIGGGPSVASMDLDALRGRRVIVINSSVYAVPWADILYFGDWRWWNEPENKAAVANFKGRVVTVSRMVSEAKNVLVCRKTNPPGLAREHDSLMQKWTSLTAATNLAAHLVGPGGTIVWLGADGGVQGGRTHHHKPHRWGSRPDAYDKQKADLATIVPDLAELKIAAFNASPGTAWADLLPVVELTDMLGDRAAA